MSARPTTDGEEVLPTTSIDDSNLAIARRLAEAFGGLPPGCISLLAKAAKRNVAVVFQYVGESAAPSDKELSTDLLESACFLLYSTKIKTDWSGAPLKDNERVRSAVMDRGLLFGAEMISEKELAKAPATGLFIVCSRVRGIGQQASVNFQIVPR